MLNVSQAGIQRASHSLTLFRSAGVTALLTRISWNFFGFKVRPARAFACSSLRLLEHLVYFSQCLARHNRNANVVSASPDNATLLDLHHELQVAEEGLDRERK